MRLFTKIVVALAAVATLGIGSAQAQNRDQLRIVGSSTVFPFSSYVAEEFGATSGFKTPVVESTGSGGGLKLFTAGVGFGTPDITNASRRIKDSELAQATTNGVTGVIEAKIGFDGIAIAQNKDDGAIDLTLKDLFLALAEEVPVNGKLAPNPYKMWNEINPALPARKIVVYGPPTTSGTRDALEELCMIHTSKKMPEYAEHKDGYKKIRQDGPYVPAGENDNLIVQKLTKDTEAFGIFGFSFLEENKDRIAGATIDGVEPAFDSISSGKYPLSRSLYFYVKKDHIGKVPGIVEYVDMFMSDKMIGEKGLLKKIGLVPLPDDMRAKVQADVKAQKTLTAEDLAKK